MITENQKSAVIAIVGRPNVGKSTLLNRIIGQKIAIVSNKPQTTRTKIMGVYTRDDTQLVFIDTPGLIKAKNRLGAYMVKSVVQSLNDVDACLLVAQGDRPVSKADKELSERFTTEKIPAILAINKIDLVQDKSVLMEQIASYSALYDFKAIVPVSARDGDGMELLVNELKGLSMEGGFLFPQDTLTDQPERVIASEIVREKLLRLLQDEVPHGIATITENMKERTGSDGKAIVDLDVIIFCERLSHKGIIIGKKGSMLKKIGSIAREDMEKFFDVRINLQLWVKVKEDWRRNGILLSRMGFDNKHI